MPLVECIQRAEQRPAARCLVAPEPLALNAAVERQLIGDQVGVDLGPFPVRLRDRFQSFNGLSDDTEERLARLDVTLRLQPVERPSVQPLFCNVKLVVFQLVPDLVEQFAAAGIELVAGQEHDSHLGIVESVDRLPAQQSGRLELIG